MKKWLQEAAKFAAEVPAKRPQKIKVQTENSAIIISFKTTVKIIQ